MIQNVEFFIYLLFMMTIAAFKVRCMACFSFLIFTFFGVVMATVAGIEVGTTRETNSTMTLVVLTKP